MDMNVLRYDNRPIESVYFPEGETITVGMYGVTKIEAYEEPGEMGLVPWIRIWKDSKYVWQRIPARQLGGIVYKED